MAFTVTETRLVKVVGEQGLALLIGTFANTAGSTGGEIKPGDNTTNISGSSGCKKIIQDWYKVSALTVPTVTSEALIAA